MKKKLKKLSLIIICVAAVASFYGCHKKPQPPVVDPPVIDKPITDDDPQPVINQPALSKINYSHLSQPLPYSDNEKVWIDDNDYYLYGYFGQCTWFGYGMFYGYYGFKPVDLTVMADSFAQGIAETYPKKFKIDDQPVQGKDMCIIFSSSDDWGHTGVITDFDGKSITYLDGNIMQIVKEDQLSDDDAIVEYLDNGDVYILARNTTHIHIDGQTANWRQTTVSYEKFCQKFPHTEFANPK